MWYLVLSHSLPDQRENKQLHLLEHRQWLEDQHRSGRVLFSGPTSDRPYGIYVVLASSLSEARRLAAEDPDHIGGIGTTEVLEWNAHRAFRLDGPTIADVERMATAGVEETVKTLA
jgi:uncharacterized protein YciI